MYTKTSRHGRGNSVRNKRRSYSSKPTQHSKYNNNSSNKYSGKYSGSSGGNSGRSKNRSGKKMPTFNPLQFINTNPADEIKDTYTPKHDFGSFGLDKRLVQTISLIGLKIPTPIQDQIIPEILKGHDVIGLAETGTGKTAAFLIPLIENTIKNPRKQTLILVPTRELAIQIDEELKKLSVGLRIFSAVCVGGINIRPQIKALRQTNQFVIGTPGRVLDLIKRKHFMPRTITTVVLDEADRMLDMGFINDMKSILSTTPKNRETLLFSATMSREADKIVNDFLHNPITISVKKRDVTNSIAQDVVRHGHHDKFETLTSLLKDPEFKRVLIFGAMKHSVEKLSKQLSTHGINADSIHGNKTHMGRQHALKKFKSGNSRVLVATDVAARGIHVDNVTHVINYDLPNTFEDYVHRIGRTGRGDKKGKALTFIPTSRKF